MTSSKKEFLKWSLLLVFNLLFSVWQVSHGQGLSWLAILTYLTAGACVSKLIDIRMGKGK